MSLNYNTQVLPCSEPSTRLSLSACLKQIQIAALPGMTIIYLWKENTLHKLIVCQPFPDIHLRIILQWEDTLRATWNAIKCKIKIWGLLYVSFLFFFFFVFLDNGPIQGGCLSTAWESMSWNGQHTFVTVVQWVCCKSHRLTNQPAAVAHGYWTFLDGQSISLVRDVRDKSHFIISPLHWRKSGRAITEYSFTVTPLEQMLKGWIRGDVCGVFCEQSIESYKKLNTL